MAVYQAEMVPWLWFLTLYSNCRIFQNKSVPDIVEQIFKDRGFPDYDLKLPATYQPREYCVQYRETDFNFVSRLLEDEGIFYFFEQTKDKHKLVIADDKSAFQACPHKNKARYTPSLGGRLDEDTVLAMEEEHKVNTGTASLADYYFEKPKTRLYATLSSPEPAEYYDYPGKYSEQERRRPLCQDSSGRARSGASRPCGARATAWALSAAISSLWRSISAMPPTRNIP